MRTSSAGLALIKKSEGLRLTAYADPATHGEPYTIGYGHTSLAGPPKVTRGMKISNSEAESILKDDLRKFESAVESLLKRPATQAEFDAMVSLTYNIGVGNFSKSTVLRKFNAGDIKGAGEAFMLFVKANGKVMQGLVNRRAEERKLFLSEAPEPISKIVEADPPEPPALPKADSEDIISQPKPIYQHRRVWTSVMGWLGGGGVALFGALDGFDYRTLLVLVCAVAVFILFFWFVYRHEIRQGLFSK